MSEYTKNDVRGVLTWFAQTTSLDVEVLNVTLAAVIMEYLGDWFAIACNDDLLNTYRRLQDITTAVMVDLPSAMDRYFSDAMVNCLWVATRQHPAVCGRRLDGLIGQRCSAEAVVISLTLVHAFERMKRSVVRTEWTLKEFLGVDIEAETHGGGLVEYVEKLLDEQ